MNNFIHRNKRGEFCILPQLNFEFLFFEIGFRKYVIIIKYC